MAKEKSHRFSKRTLDFLAKAGRQKNPDWLVKNTTEYEENVKIPFIELAEQIKLALKPLAPDYHFPSKGLARLKRPAFKVAGGEAQHKDWLSMIPTRPSKSRFESNPHLFFGIFASEKDSVIVAAGLWQPSSTQTRRIREAISQDSQPFRKLFSDAQFKKRFKGSWSMENVSKRTPRGFSEDHKDLDWIKLKNFIVTKKISLKDFSAAKFNESVIEDFKQGLRLNKLLDLAIAMKWPPQ